MHPTTRLLAAPGFPSFWKRSMEEFKNLSRIAIKLEGVHGPKKTLQMWEFSNQNSVEACIKMSDQTIGGFSTVDIQYVPPSNTDPSHVRFSGNISNELPKSDTAIERTGYAAWRTRDRPATIFGKPMWDVSHIPYLALRVKSDGRKYKVNVQTESLEVSDLHQHRLYCRRPGEWETIMIRWDDFVRTNHGVVVEPQSEMLQEKVRTIGIGLTDRRAGPFELCISRIWATSQLSDQEQEEARDFDPALVPRELGKSDVIAETTKQS